MVEHRFFFAAVLLCSAAVFALACGRGPTEPEVTCTTATVFANESFYRALPDVERDFTGTILKDAALCDLVPPNGRSTCFIFSDTRGTLRVPLLYTSKTQFDSYVGQPVVVRGKIVSVTNGLELWPASISCR